MGAADTEVAGCGCAATGSFANADVDSDGETLWVGWGFASTASDDGRTADSAVPGGDMKEGSTEDWSRDGGRAAMGIALELVGTGTVGTRVVGSSNAGTGVET